ncbi:hypothetical protein C0992_002830 [Termitomyces sp. T32_za158]|nr:hypothetical protein C0992_002830 [Termitomyces sp. T32_za158]
MPGPKELTGEQLNNAMEPIANEFNQLKQGVKMEIHGEDLAVVYADCLCDNCDTPAAHKFKGSAGHTHDYHPCSYCNANVLDINQFYGGDDSPKKRFKNIISSIQWPSRVTQLLKNLDKNQSLKKADESFGAV